MIGIEFECLITVCNIEKIRANLTMFAEGKRPLCDVFANHVSATEKLELKFWNSDQKVPL